MARSGHLHPEAPQAWHSYYAQAKSPLSNCPFWVPSLCRWSAQLQESEISLRFDVCSVAQVCLTLCNPTYCSLPGSSAHVIFQARLLQWVPFPTLGDLPDPGTEPASLVSPALTGRFFTISTTWEAHALMIWLTLDSSLFPSRIFLFSLILFHRCLD